MLKALDRWLIPYLLRRRPKRDASEPLHLVIAVCDHLGVPYDTLYKVRQMLPGGDLPNWT